MIEITKELEKLLLDNYPDKFGHYSEYGAVMGDKEFVLVYQKDKIYLAHKSEFEEDGIFVRLKNKIECPCNNCSNPYCTDSNNKYTGANNYKEYCISYKDWINKCKQL